MKRTHKPPTSTKCLFRYINQIWPTEPCRTWFLELLQSGTINYDTHHVGERQRVEDRPSVRSTAQARELGAQEGRAPSVLEPVRVAVARKRRIHYYLHLLNPHFSN